MEKIKLIGSATARTHPSLALIKYWGKTDTKLNLPATSSIAVGLAELSCTTQVKIHSPGGQTDDQVMVNNKLQKPERFSQFFSSVRTMAKAAGHSESFKIQAVSELNFPPSAGLASSSAGFAALSLACIEALRLDGNQASALARIGSASAARAVFGGFTLFPAGAESAVQLYKSSYWPDLRIVIVEVTQSPKSVSSRDAMEICSTDSPFYQAWVEDAAILTGKAEIALEQRDLTALGPLIRQSAMRMFAVMLSVREPIRYWKPGTLQVLDLVENMRKEGFNMWETMDAGPQVKVICNKTEAMELVSRLKHRLPDFRIRICSPAPEPGRI